MNTSHNKRTTKRRRTARRIRSDWRYRQLDREGRWHEDVLTGDLIETITAEEAAAIAHYVALCQVQPYLPPNYALPYYPEHDLDRLGSLECLCN